MCADNWLNIIMLTADQFFETYRESKSRLPEIPSILKTDEEITRWLFKQNIPYIELDLEFDVEQWLAESKIAEPFLVNHRESQPHLGWRSCCIHGIDVDKTGIWSCYTDSEPEYHWTGLSEKTPVITKFWQDFPFEKLSRVRFMELSSGGFIAPHNDSPEGYGKDFDSLTHLIPINIAITHPDDCWMTLKDHGIVPWKAGNIKLVNITNDHSVINFSNRPRMHLIGHGIPGNRRDQFCELIVRSYRKQYERNRI
jgi:hypothetical protein